MAQEIDDILLNKLDTDDQGYKSMSYNKLVAVLIEATKDLKNQVSKLQAKVNELENK